MPDTTLSPGALPADERATEAPRVRRPSKRELLLGLLALAVIAGAAWWLVHRGIESTDDAQVDADIVAVQTQLAGTVREVLFHENQRVRAGQVLVVLDDAEAKAHVAQAEAALAAAEAAADAAEAEARVTETNAVGDQSIAAATLRSAAAAASGAHDTIAEAEASLRSARAALAQAGIDRDRQRQLFEAGSVARATFEQSQTAFDLAQATADAAAARLDTLRATVAEARGHVAEASARVRQSSDVQAMIDQANARARELRAQVGVARAQLDLARLELEHTRVIAAATGVVSKKSVAVGQRVAMGAPIGQLVTDARWVTANFKETEVGHMREGHPATITVDAFPGVSIRGHVESFSGATGSRFTLLPPDNASGNFTKVVQRVSVRIRLDRVPRGIALRPGMSVIADVDTRGHRS